MTVALQRSQLDARRGVVRLHPAVLDMLGLRPWDPLRLEGTRTTGALAAAASFATEQQLAVMDDLTCINAGVDPGGQVGVSPARVQPAATVALTATPDVQGDDPDPAALRFALLGKVVTAGDHVSLLPQDFSRVGMTDPGSWLESARTLAGAFGDGWQGMVLLVSDSSPPGLVRVTMETEVSWDGSASTATSAAPLTPAGHAVSPEDVPGLERQLASLREWLDLGFHRSDLLGRLGAKPQMGVMVTGPPGSGKATLVAAAAAVVGATLFRLWGPAVARGDAGAALRRGFEQAERAAPAVLIIEDVDAIAPREGGGPAFSVLLELVEAAMARGRLAVVCTTAHPEATCPDLRRPGLLDHELEIPLPPKDDRRRILEVQCRRLPLARDVRLADVAARAPGFVAADLVALCREAVLRAAHRASEASPPEESPTVTQADFEAALEVVKPSALDGASVELAEVRLEDVGDMEATKKELIEAVIWPLSYPDTFARLGVEPPRGVLLFGPPGCGKTFLVKALAHEAEANFLSVKGAELLSKWVGESERGVRELFRRARSAAPALVFFDEVDALAPVRGGSSDQGVTDRVVAQLLTELDGIEDLRDVYVVAATNRPDLVDPALIRPGRLERLVYVPPPDGAARVAILRAVARRMPLGPEIDLDSIGEACEGYSAADLDALAREAAMTAMRENMAAPVVTAAHFEAARQRVRPSLRPEQVVELAAFAASRAR